MGAWRANKVSSKQIVSSTGGNRKRQKCAVNTGCKGTVDQKEKPEKWNRGCAAWDSNFGSVGVGVKES